MELARRNGQPRQGRPNPRQNIPGNRKDGANARFKDIRPFNPTALTSITLPAAFLIVLVNIAVIYVILRKKSLRRLRNMPLVSLAFADLSVGILLGPLFAATQLSTDRTQLCSIYLVAEVFCFTASLLNMLVVSIERWIAIFQPLRYTRYVTPLLVWGMITAAWLLSLIIATSQSWVRRPVKSRFCVYSWRRLASFPFVFSSMFFLSSFLTGIMQIRIYLIVRSHRKRIAPRLSRDIYQDAEITVGQSSSPVQASRYVAKAVVQENLTTREINALGISLTQESRHAGRRQSRITQVLFAKERTLEGDIPTRSWRSGSGDIAVSRGTETPTLVTINLEEIPRGQKIVKTLHETLNEPICIVSHAADTPGFRRRAQTRASLLQLKLEQKTMKLASLLYLFFIAMWSPYIIMMLVQVTRPCDSRCLIAVVITKTLMFFNSLANPFVFTIRMKEFRVAFKGMICRDRVRRPKPGHR